MIRYRHGFLLAALVAAPVLAQSTVNCSSDDGQKHFCQADTSRGVVLTREYSDNRCQQGSTWGYTRNGIHVSGGCSADFQLGGGQGGRDSYANDNDNGNGRSGDDDRDRGNNNSGYNRSDRDSDNNSRGNSGYDRDRNGSGSGRAMTIPANTRLRVRTDSAINLTSLNQGDTISATLAEDLVVGGNVIATEGTPVRARVVAVNRNSQDDQDSAAPDIRLDSMNLNGQRYTLDSTSVHGVRDSEQARNGDNSGGGFGALVGALAGNRQGQLPAGSVLSFTLVRAARPE